MNSLYTHLFRITSSKLHEIFYYITHEQTQQKSYKHPNRPKNNDIPQNRSPMAHHKPHHFGKEISRTIQNSSFTSDVHKRARNISRVLQLCAQMGHDGTQNHTPTDKSKAPSNVEGLDPVSVMPKMRGSAPYQHLPTKRTRMSAQRISAQAGRRQKMGQGGVRSWSGLGLGYGLQHQCT